MNPEEPLKEIVPPETLTPKQALFIQEHSKGTHESAGAAAVFAGYNASRARKTASRILGRDDAKQYLRALHERTAAQVDMTREELANLYVQILRAKPSEADENNPLCHPVHLKEETAFVFPELLATGDRLVRLMGWDKQEEKNNQAGASFLMEILKKRDI